MKYFILNLDGGDSAYEIAKIEKITPKEFIKVKGKLFNPNGNCRDSWYHTPWICPINEETQNEYETEQKRKESKRKQSKLNNFNFEILPEERLNEIYNLTFGEKSG